MYVQITDLRELIIELRGKCHTIMHKIGHLYSAFTFLFHFYH